jgi:molybdopterin converting factor small subunit
MCVEFQFYATLRDAVGQRTVRRELPEETTLPAAVRAVADDHEGLASLLFGDDGDLRSHVTVAVNGDPVLENRERTTVADGDTLVLSPGVSGGGPPAR